MKFAAIDIGSNAVRLLFSNVAEVEGKVHFHKASLVRVPVRLGTDTFLEGRISEERKTDLIKTMIAYRNLIEVYRVDDCMACATSAMREAENGKEVIKAIKKEAGIDIQLIDGIREAQMIYATHAAENLDEDKSYLYIDVGGGSTEITIFSKGMMLASQSFKIGTIRVMENLVPKSEYELMKNWIHLSTKDLSKLSAIGTGGNINKVFKMTGTKQSKPLSIRRLVKMQKELDSFSYDDKVNILGLRPDRADVIVPAISIYLSVLRWAGIKEIYVPKIGLVDGMVHLLYEKKTGA
jgi:exopolyphosphatase / guanosine-5'-triphosphate,3'-diphosphate pyrophosphatase